MERIAIGGNFTLSPIDYYIPEIEKILNQKVHVSIAHDNQTFQLFSDKASIFHKSTVTALFIKLDYLIKQASEKDNLNLPSIIRDSIKEFANIYHGHIFIFLCPLENSLNEAIQSAKKTILTLRAEKSITFFSAEEILSLYPYTNIFNSYTEQQASIPYSQEYYNILSVYLIRMAHAISNQHKVIAIDCDNTLWTGICGEDLFNEITISPSQRALQEFLIQKQAEGFLICLCSNNNLEDVTRVFNNHGDMLLSLNDIAISQINWQPKYQKLVELSKDLNLNLDSFIFMDDNPVEIELVDHHLPQVTLILWPADENAGKRLLLHLWALDKLSTTLGDVKRTERYQKEKLRKCSKE